MKAVASSPAVHRLCALAAALALCSVAAAARAQLAVIDAASVAQLVQQVQTLTQQLLVLRQQLVQAQSLYQSMTGSRGMQALAGSPQSNYLPTDWTELMAALQGGGSYTALSAGISGALGSNAVLSPAQLAALSADEQTQIGLGRQAVALLQGLTQQALGNSSARFADLEQLLAAIGSTADQKSILELQATLGAERGLLQNEQTKLQVLYQAAQSQQWAARQHERELVVAGQGRFASRFEPVPP